MAPTRGRVSSRPVLRAVDLRKAFRKGPPWHRRAVPVLQGATLEVRAGELVGLVGENGSGKSVLIQVIVGMLAADEGVVERPERLGYCPQDAVLWDKLTVAEHFDLFAQAYGMDGFEATRARDEQLETLAFARYLGYRVEELSGGTRQKLNLALALMHDPELLLLDEPYAGFDWETYQCFWEIAEKRRAAGRAILVVSHLLSERERLTRVLELRDGVIA